MKYCQFFIFLSLLLTLTSCGGDNDICESGEGTPRMKIRFRNLIDNKLRKVDTLYVYADYGSGKVSLGKNANVDSILVPIRVDDSPYTDLYFKTRLNEQQSKVRVNYTTKSTYVSPGCGVKKTYENLNSQLLESISIKKLESGQNFIENEDKTNLYLLF